VIVSLFRDVRFSRLELEWREFEFRAFVVLLHDHFLLIIERCWLLGKHDIRMLAAKQADLIESDTRRTTIHVVRDRTLEAFQQTARAFRVARVANMMRAFERSIRRNISMLEPFQTLFMIVLAAGVDGAFEYSRIVFATLVAHKTLVALVGAVLAEPVAIVIVCRS